MRDVFEAPSGPATAQSTRPPIGLDGLGDALGRIEVVRLKVVLRSLDGARLPGFLGSTLRGALARSTWRVSCALNDGECPACLLRLRCTYSYFFETFRPPGAYRLRGQERLPHPLVLTAPEPRDEPYAEDEELGFGVTLFGHAASHLPYLVAALEDMAAQGLGRGRKRFELVTVETSPLRGGPRTVFAPGCLPEQPPVEELASHLSRIPADARTTLKLKTPTRLRVEGRLTRSPRLEDFVRSLIQRALTMLHFHCGYDVDFDIEALTNAAREVPVATNDLDLVRLPRWSSRQGRKVPLDGMIGSISFAGAPVRELWPLMLAGEVLRVGKGTVFGLGRYELLSERAALERHERVERERGTGG